MVGAMEQPALRGWNMFFGFLVLGTWWSLTVERGNPNPTVLSINNWFFDGKIRHKLSWRVCCRRESNGLSSASSCRSCFKEDVGSYACSTAVTACLPVSGCAVLPFCRRLSDATPFDSIWMGWSWVGSGDHLMTFFSCCTMKQREES